MGAVQTCASTQQQSDFWLTLLKKIKMDKITSKNTKRALRNRNAKNTTVCSEEANIYFVVGRGVARLNGARGKKQIWHPHSRTWTLSEAYFLERGICDTIGTFRRPISNSAPQQWFDAPIVIWRLGFVRPLPPPHYAPECRIMLLALHIALIRSTTLSFALVHFKHEQPQFLSPDAHVTTGTIQQTQEAANVLWVYRHNSWHTAWPTVILRFMETRWKTLAQNRHQKIFNRGALRLCRGLDILQFDKNSWFIALVISIWGAWSFFGGGLAHQSPPVVTGLPWRYQHGIWLGE